MKNIFYLGLISIVILYGCNVSRITDQDDVDTINDLEQFEKQLNSIPGISTKKIDHNQEFYIGAYEVFFTQPIDHKDPSKGTFTQKFYLNHKDVNAPMIFNINGYSVSGNGFVSELVPMLNANFIHIEHRFFADSKPDPLDYDYLTIEQAANDHHNIIQQLKEIYSGKWVSTGISKGGQATIFHRTYFPDDVDVSIPYVAPVNLAVEDERLVSFLDNVGTDACRNTILEYQRALLSNYDDALKEFESRAEKNNLSFPMGTKKAFELSILEFEFAYWQWSGGESCDQIPGYEADMETLMNQLFTIDAPGFFTTSAIDYFFPFFYQAYAELGMYGYAVDSLDGYLREYTEYVNNYHTFIPEHMEVVYVPETLQKVHEFLLEKGNEFIHIYGENDAWSATAFVADEQNTNAVTLFKEDGSHFTRINDLAPAQKEIVYEKLEEWLDVQIDK